MANKIGTILSRAAALSSQDWRYLAIAAKELFLARIRLAVQPIGIIVRDLQKERLLSDREVRAIDVARLSWAIRAAARRMPWRCDCLPQALAADRWLRRHHLQSQFFLGTAKDAAGGLEAHAWLRCKGIEVTGGNGQGFTVLLEPASEEASHYRYLGKSE